MLKTCIRREIKSDWERRAPLTPDAVKGLISKGLPISVEACDVRKFSDRDYEEAGATIVDQCENAELILGIKEPQIEAVQPNQVHVAFSHTIKGQSYNMALLKAFLDQKGTLIDYETMRDTSGTRVIAFGRYAGIAGAVDTFHLAGKKWQQKGIASDLVSLGMTHGFHDLDELSAHLRAMAPLKGEPLKVLIVGTGNVSQGCVEVCQWLGLPSVPIEAVGQGKAPESSWYAVAGTEDIFRKRDGGPYDRAEFREYGAERYENAFTQYLGHFNVLLQTSYWATHYPRQLDFQTLREYRDKLPFMIGDISCDINGSLQCTQLATTIDDPAMTYLPDEEKEVQGISWAGPTIMSIDHLPCELSFDASNDFSRILKSLVPLIAGVSLDKPLHESGMSQLLQDATIVYRGELTPNYKYLEAYLNA